MWWYLAIGLGVVAVGALIIAANPVAAGFIAEKLFITATTEAMKVAAATTVVKYAAGIAVVAGLGTVGSIYQGRKQDKQQAYEKGYNAANEINRSQSQQLEQKNAENNAYSALLLEKSNAQDKEINSLKRQFQEIKNHQEVQSIQNNADKIAQAKCNRELEEKIILSGNINSYFHQTTNQNPIETKPSDIPQKNDRRGAKKERNEFASNNNAFTEKQDGSSEHDNEQQKRNEI